MTDRHEKINVRRTQNMKKALKHGPGLRYDTKIWIEARDRTKGRVLIGGLGGMGVGSMWFDELKDHQNYPGYDDAPEQEASNERDFFAELLQKWTNEGLL